MITHLFASGSLDRHRRETRAAQAVYEVEREKSEFRIQERQMVLSKELAAKAGRRNQDLEQLLEVLNTSCSGALAMKPKMLALNEHMVMAMDLWWQLESVRTTNRYHRSCIDLLKNKTDFYNKALVAYDSLAETQECKEWRDMIERTSLVIDNVHIRQAMKRHVEPWTEARETEVKRQKARIKSAIRGTNHQKTAMYNEYNEGKSTEKELKGKLQQEREEVFRLYQTLKGEWFDLSRSVNDYGRDLKCAFRSIRPPIP